MENKGDIMKKIIMYLIMIILIILSVFSIYLHNEKESKKADVEYVTIRFAAEDNEIEDKMIEKGEKIGELSKPILAGYKFLYWSLNNEEINEDYIATEDITLKAVFEEIKLSIETYVVVFNSNGAKEIDNQIINKGEKVIKPSDPVKKGYIFLYWSYKDLEYDFDSEVTSDLALRAVYKLDNTNDVTGPVIKLNGDLTITMPVGTEFEDPGYTATDDYDGDVTDKVVRSGNVDYSKAGEYKITYSVSDEKGNSSTVTRTLIYEE